MDQLEEKIRLAISDEWFRRVREKIEVRAVDHIEAFTQRVMRVLEEELEPHCDVVDPQGRKLYGGTPKEVRTWILTEYKAALEVIHRHELFNPPQPDEKVRMGSPYNKDVSIDNFLIMWS
jgi:hypothetical protein